jgi:hypothetical protein
LLLGVVIVSKLYDHVFNRVLKGLLLRDLIAPYLVNKMGPVKKGLQKSDFVKFFLSLEHVLNDERVGVLLLHDVVEEVLE